MGKKPLEYRAAASGDSGGEDDGGGVGSLLCCPLPSFFPLFSIHFLSTAESNRLVLGEICFSKIVGVVELAASKFARRSTHQLR